jgi:hypothetical protein
MTLIQGAQRSRISNLKEHAQHMRNDRGADGGLSVRHCQTVESVKVGKWLSKSPRLRWSRAKKKLFPRCSANDVNIPYGTALANSQLSGSASYVLSGIASVPGVFTFTTAATTMLGVGDRQRREHSFKTERDVQHHKPEHASCREGVRLVLVYEQA